MTCREDKKTIIKDITPEQKKKQYVLMNMLYKGAINDAIHWVKDQQVDINQPYNKFGWTPFMYIVKEFFEVDIVKKFIELGGSLIKKNNEGETPLMIAAKKRSSGNILSVLIENGSPIDEQDNWGFTPLMRAISHPQFTIRKDVALTLIDNGADLTKLKNCQGLTAIEMLIERA